MKQRFTRSQQFAVSRGGSPSPRISSTSLWLVANQTTFNLLRSTRIRLLEFGRIYFVGWGSAATVGQPGNWNLSAFDRAHSPKFISAGGRPSCSPRTKQVGTVAMKLPLKTVVKMGTDTNLRDARWW